jgi:hypothetical protein
MAALRANTMHKTTNINFCKLKTASLECIANEKPIKANGKAKMV